MAKELSTNALISLEDIKLWLNLEGQDVERDNFLRDEINDWSSTIETRLGRVIHSTTHTDERHDGGKLSVILNNIPVTDISSITVDDGALGSSDYVYVSESGIVRLVSGLPFGGGPGSVLVTYTGGYTEVPGDLKRAVKQIVAIGFYLSGHGRKSIAKRGESTAQGNVEYNRGPEDQGKILKIIERIYGRR